jgi:hypothetical protein
VKKIYYSLVKKNEGIKAYKKSLELTNENAKKDIKTNKITDRTTDMFLLRLQAEHETCVERNRLHAVNT